ncbi:MAG: sigma-54-dependent Fis family transcriptional regulator [Deltaproteobacteria bacterium]|nr:sigma-54-dependent Fis family transcriptional regulator [Deltaproteobacteria bacterium]
MMLASILIVDDEPQLAMYLKRLLIRKGYDVATAKTAADARRKMEQIYPDVVLMDLRLPDADGGELISEFREDYPDTRFIVVTAHGSIKSAVESTRRGASNYLTKPFESEELLLAIRAAMKSKMLSEEVQLLRSRERTSVTPNGLVSGTQYQAESMRRVFELAERSASKDGIVLLLGESGTGKNYLARWIHRHSPRSDGPFFSINCAAVSRELAESELFGHEPGAFTGTRGRKRGMLELADKGTILLDEIGEMDLQLQSKLLSFLDTKSFMRVGGEREIKIDARILAATNRDLFQDVNQGRFRNDLYYRLNVMPIELPPLRRRVADIPILAKEMLSKLSKEMHGNTPFDISQMAVEALNNYNWPGNIRELRNVLERAAITSDTNTINEHDLGLSSTSADWSYEVSFPDHDVSLHQITQNVASALIKEALRRSKTKSAAAQLLGISRDALNYQMKTLSLR